MGSAKTSLLDVRDVAAATTKALFSAEEHSGKTYELMGPEALSNDEIATRIARITGRDVKYVDIPVETQRKSMLDAGMPEWQVTALLDLQAYYVTGECAAVTDLLPNLLGRAPITIDQFLNENKETFRSQAAVA